MTAASTPALCQAHGTPFCYECAEDVADVSMLRREVVGPHPITGQVVVRWVHRDGCPGEAEETPIVGGAAPAPRVVGKVETVYSQLVPFDAKTPGLVVELNGVRFVREEP